MWWFYHLLNLLQRKLGADAWWRPAHRYPLCSPQPVCGFAGCVCWLTDSAAVMFRVAPLVLVFLI